MMNELLCAWRRAGWAGAALLLMLSPYDYSAALPTQTDGTGEQLRTVTIRIHVPVGAGVVYLTGNRPELGNWNPTGFVMMGSGMERTATLRLPSGTRLEYKFALGSWDREGLGPSGTVMPNYRLLVDTDTNVTVVLSGFERGGPTYLRYVADWKSSGVLGRLSYWTNVPSRFLTGTRNVEIWLPPGYDDHPTKRFDVLYMQDGQNLFDPRLSFTGVSWGVDKAIMRCVKARKIAPLIVVGVWNTDQRLREYSPWDEGTNYAKFLIEELMPQVNEKFRTLTGPKHTSVMGSSMGGLISFWLCWKHPDVFGRAGCLSTTLPWNGHIPMDSSSERPFIDGEIAAGATVPRGIRLYFDYGTGTDDSSIGPEQARVAAWLRSNGLKEGRDFTVRKFPGAQHNEAAWRARLDVPLIFLFGSRIK